MKVQVDKDIPFPYQQEEKGGGGISKNRKVYPWYDMVLGDSFLFRNIASYKNLQIARVACNQHSYHEKIFLNAEYKGTIRIWRVK